MLAGNSVRSVSYSLGNGDGTFQPSTVTPTSALLHPMLTDLDGDGFPDLTGVMASAPNTWLVLVNNRHEKFGFSESDGYAFPINDFTSGDFNNDGKIDFAVTTEDTQRTIQALNIELGDGDGSFQFMLNAVAVGDVIATGHFDSDSALDLAGGGGQSMTLRTVYGRGDGTFVRQPPSP